MEVGPPVPQPPWVLRVLRPTAPGRDTDGPRKSPGQNAASGRRRSDKPGHGRWQNRLGGNVDGGRGSRDHTPRTGLQSPQGRSSAQFWWQRGGPQCSATSPSAKDVGEDAASKPRSHNGTRKGQRQETLWVPSRVPAPTTSEPA